MKKKVLALVMAVLMLGSLALTGCKKEAPIAGDKVAEAIFDMILKNDMSTTMDLFGFSTEEEARKALNMEGDLYEDLADQMVSQFSVYGISVTTEEMQEFVDAFISMFSSVDFSAKVKESDEKAGTAVVTCTISTFNPEDLSVAMTEAMEELDPSILESGDMNAAFGPILKAMAGGIANIKPSGKTADFDVDFELVNMDVGGKATKVWMPKDAGEFGSLISTTAIAG